MYVLFSKPNRRVQRSYRTVNLGAVEVRLNFIPKTAFHRYSLQSGGTLQEIFGAKTSLGKIKANGLGLEINQVVHALLNLH